MKTIKFFPALLAFTLLAASTILRAQEQRQDMARPLSEVVSDIATQFDLTLKIPNKALLENKMLPWADYRIRRYSGEESLRNVLAPFDLMFEAEGGKTYRIIAYDHPRRTPAEGAAEIRFLTELYKDTDAWEKRFRALRPALLAALRLDPAPPRPASEPVFSDARDVGGAKARNFALETLPGVYVCGTLYSPANPRGRQPLILAPNGHFPGGRYHKDQQILCGTLARMGAHVVSYDLFAYGESLLQFDQASHRTPMAQTMQILNGLRIVDWFSGQPYAHFERIAVTGASGGGSQTMMLAALDTRVSASAPVVMLSANFDGGCPCESGRPVHLADGGMNNAELAAMAAPHPQLVVSCGGDWTRNVPAVEFPFLKHIYKLAGAPANVTNAHLPGESHDYGPNKRAAVYAFFAKHFRMDASAIDESACVIEPEIALKIFGDNGERLPANAIKGMAALETIFEKESRRAAAALAASAPAATATAGDPWEMVPAILARIKAPAFPDRVYPITQYGAPLDGRGDSSEAIRKAITACNAAGGGTVLVPPGDFVTGPVYIKSNVNLRLERGARLLFKTDPGAYMPPVLSRWEGVEIMNFSPLVYSYEEENIAITGEGTLDGQADKDTWWPMMWLARPSGPGLPDDSSSLGAVQRYASEPIEKMNPAARIFGKGHHLRPPFIQPYKSKNVLIEGITVVRAPFWQITPVLCRNVTVRGVKVISHGYNNDGVNPDSCSDVLIEDTFFDTGDDCIAIKSGRNNDGRRVNVPAENIIIRNCVMKDGHGGVSIGSEISGGCRNVFIENCRMDSPNLDIAYRFKTNAARGGVIENIHMRNVQVGRVADSVVRIDYYYQEGINGGHMPAIRNVSMENVTSRSSPRAMTLRGFPTNPIRGVTISNCTFDGVEAFDIIENVEDYIMKNVTINRRPVAEKTPD